MLIVKLIATIITIPIALWVGNDAKKRGMNPWGWGIGSFLILIVFLPLYLFTRKPIQRSGSGIGIDILD